MGSSGAVWPGLFFYFLGDGTGIKVYRFSICIQRVSGDRVGLKLA